MSPLAVAREQHLETVMKMIVKGIKDKAGVAVVPPPVSRIRGVVAEKLICARSNQSKLVACTWLLVLDARWTKMKIGPGSLAPSDEFRSV
jgi:hypothetical protein